MIYQKWWNFHRNFHSKLLKYQSVFQTSHSMGPDSAKMPQCWNSKHWRSFVVRHALISSYIYVRKPARIWIEPCFLGLMESVFSVPWCFFHCLLCDFLCVNLSTWRFTDILRIPTLCASPIWAMTQTTVGYFWATPSSSYNPKSSLGNRFFGPQALGWWWFLMTAFIIRKKCWRIHQQNYPMVS